MLESREGDDLSDINRAIRRVCLNEYDNDCDEGDTSDVDELHDEQRHQSKPLLKCSGECASLPSAVSPPGDDNGEIETSLSCIFSEDSLQSPCSRSISMPTPLKLVSALKGSREKRGSPAKELRVTWSPDVYDPRPTSASHTFRGKKQHKSKSKKNYDKKRSMKKGHKGYNSSRGGSKDNKQFHRGNGSSDRWYDYKPLEPLEVHISRNLDGFKVVSTTDPFCGTSFLKKSPTRVHYSVAEAL